MQYLKVLFPPKWQIVLLTLIVAFVYLFTIKKKYKLSVLLLILISSYALIGLLFSMWKCDSTERFEKETKEENGICSGGCSANKKLLPILNPKFNLHECAKEIILLEDHLNNPEKRCEDCIKKHCLKIEGLAEECVGLDKKGVCKEECVELAKKMRKIEKQIAEGKSLNDIAQQLRSIRKPLMIKYFLIEESDEK